jgi:hypothetical protein
MPISVNFQLGNFPQNYCFTTLQGYANDLIALLTGTITGNFTGVIVGPNVPAVGDQDKAWIKTDSNGRPVGLFLFLGQWIWPNPRAANSNERMIWAGTEASLWSYDGGDGTDPVANPPSSTTGAMWMVDTAFAFRVPVGLNNLNTATNPTTYDGNPGTVITQGVPGGEERHLLGDTEVPAGSAHKHVTGRRISNANSLTDFLLVTPVAPPAGSASQCGQSNAAVTEDIGADTGPYVGTAGVVDPPVVKSHQNMPPYMPVNMAKRSARIFYAAS